MERLYGLPDNERIFPIVAEAVQHKLKWQCEKAGVKKIRVYDLRHSHVAYLINQGVQPLIIKERLGHRDIKITVRAEQETEQIVQQNEEVQQEMEKLSATNALLR